MHIGPTSLFLLLNLSMSFIKASLPSFFFQDFSFKASQPGFTHFYIQRPNIPAGFSLTKLRICIFEGLVEDEFCLGVSIWAREFL